MESTYFMDIIKIILIAIMAAILSKACIPVIIRFLSDSGCVLSNYKGAKTVYGMGIVFVPIQIIALSIGFFFFNYEILNYTAFLFAICATGFAGLLDDMIGDKTVKGYKNHITCFLKGKLTTGFLKAMIGFLVSSVLATIISKSVLDFIINLLNIALFTNTLNLLDLRPGRSSKLFIFIGIIIVLIKSEEASALLPLLVMLITAAVYAGYDLKEHCMLGDTGSNILGITLGYFSTFLHSAAVRLLILAILLIVNVGAECISITKLISKSKLLSYIDGLGRSSGQ